MSQQTEKLNVPVWRKTTLSVEEAAALSGIGEAAIRELLTRPLCPFRLKRGSHVRVKRAAFEDYLDKVPEI